MLTNYKNIIWDFDGVILDSMPIRERGFALIFEQYPEEQVNQLLAYHHANGGLSRFAKIRYFYEQILGKPITDEQVSAYAQSFSAIMRQRLNRTELLIADSVAFIRSAYQQYNFHVVSASEQTELRYLVEHLGLSPYFKSVYGSPTLKADNIRKVMEENSYQADETCLIGDSKNDFEASVKNNISFLGYNNLQLLELGKGYLHSFKDNQ